MVNPKEAQRRAQLKAREKKRQNAERQRAKKAAHQALSFDGVLERWLDLDQNQLPRCEPCPSCSKGIEVEADGDELVHRHEFPHCAAYAAFSRASDEMFDTIEGRSKSGISMREVADRMLPAWTQGPLTELTEEKGDELLDSGDVVESTMLTGLGMIESIMYARTDKGLFSWKVANVIDDEDDDFDDEDESEGTEARPA